MLSRLRPPRPTSGVRRRPTGPATRRAAAALTGAVATLGAGVLVAPPASATVSTLCTGYTGCAALGMGNAGYSAVSRTMYWRMYGGHNCTNYAAYRMIQAGLPNVRPWSGDGNATSWGTLNPAITNSTPTVGSIAWWKAGVKPAGSAGHVAYVEQVISANEIVVSQDSWNGDFSWTRVTRTTSGWPSGFVHFADVRARNLAVPVVTGTAKVGSVLSASAGTWSPTGLATTYQWLAGGVPVPGATAATLTVPSTLVGQALAVRVTASGSGLGAVTATSAATTAVLPSVISNAEAPSVSGTPAVGQALSVDPGAWTPDPDAVTYRWLAGGKVVPGATGATFVPGSDLVGLPLAVRVTATRAGYPAATLTTPATSAVALGSQPVPATPVVSGTTSPGSTLRVTLPAAPAGTTSAVSWRRDGAVVPGATGTSLVLGTADLGHRLSATWTLSRAGYRDASATSAATTLVRTPSSLLVTTVPRARALRITAVVTRGDRAAAYGTLVVRRAGRVLTRVPVVAGRASTTLADTSGAHTYRFRFATTSTVLGSEVLRTLTVG